MYILVCFRCQIASSDRFVFTVENDTARYRKIELGQRLGENQEILSGINAGDVVVTAGQTRLLEGTPVEIVKN